MGRSRYGIIGPDDPSISYFDGVYSASHRFIKEQIDALQPDKHNRYIYCYNNPVNNIDPLGLFISESGIEEGRYVYTLSAGWVDMDHVGEYARHHKAIVDSMKIGSQGKVELPSVVPYASDRRNTFEFDIENKDINTEAMRVLYQAARQEEIDQGSSGPFGLLGGWTSFAFEDITSDMVGGLVSQISAEEGISIGEAIAIFRDKAGVVTQDRAGEIFRENREVLTEGTLETATQPEMSGLTLEERAQANQYREWENLESLVIQEQQRLIGQTEVQDID